MSAVRVPIVSYRARLIAGFAVVVTLLAVAWGWSILRPLADSIESQQRERLLGVARAGASLLAVVDGDAEPLMHALAGDTGLRVTIVAADGRVVADTEADARTMENHLDRPEVAAALAGRTGSDVRTSATQGVDRMYVAVPATYRGQTVALRVSEPVEHIDALIARARRTGALLLVVALCAALIISGRIARATGEPVDRLVQAAAAMAAGDLDSPVPAATGRLQELADALSDLRHQMHARIAELEQERLSLREILDGLDDGVLLLDGDVVRVANRAVLPLTRSAPESPTGRTFDDIGLPATITATIREGLRDRTPLVRDLGPDAFHRYHRVSVLPFHAAERGTRTLVVIADTTDRMRLDRVRRDFVANASHELKTPTAGILLLAESARHASEDGDVERALAFVSQIESEATRLRTLVSDLLDLSRLEASAAPDALTDIRKAVDLALAASRRAAAQKDLLLGSVDESPPDTDLIARADPTDVAIALDNLLSNAITYTERGNVTVSTSIDEDDIVIEVSDTGIGIPPEDLPRVFERFYRVDRGRSRASGGTGLGLSLVRNVAERSGGSVSIESELGSWTRVTLRLPRAS